MFPPTGFSLATWLVASIICFFLHCVFRFQLLSIALFQHANQLNQSTPIGSASVLPEQCSPQSQPRSSCDLSCSRQTIRKVWPAETQQSIKIGCYGSKLFLRNKFQTYLLSQRSCKTNASGKVLGHGASRSTSLKWGWFPFGSPLNTNRKWGGPTF